MTRNTKKMQIYDLLKERIESGFYPPGTQLPKEVDLAVELGVSRVTLRPALELLELERLVRREKGFGTFVRDTKIGQTRLLVIVSRNDPSQTDYASNPFPYIMPCLRLEAERMNSSLEVCDCQSLETLDARQCAARIAERGIQGIIWMDNNFTGREPLLEPVRKTGLPVLLPHANLSDAEITGFTAMGTNYRELICDGLKYLAAQGHSRAAYIGDPDMRGIRPENYLEWVEAAGLDPDPELLRLVEWRRGKQIVFEAVARLLDLSDPPTAIFSYSDYLSLQIYEYLHGKKIRIPDDICVLTTGGQIGCDFLNPPLSSLDYCNQEIAGLAMKTMLEMIHDGRRMDFIVTPHCLTVRESTKKVILHHNQLKPKKEKRK